MNESQLWNYFSALKYVSNYLFNKKLQGNINCLVKKKAMFAVHSDTRINVEYEIL